MPARWSSARLHFCQPLNPALPRVPNRRSRDTRCGTCRIISSAVGISGNVCWRPFLVRVAGIVQVDALKVELAPPHAAHLAAAGAEQHQQTHDATEVVILADAPDRDHFGVA